MVFTSRRNHLGYAMVSVIAKRAVDLGFEHLSNQVNDAVLRSKSNDRVARNEDNKSK